MSCTSGPILGNVLPHTDAGEATCYAPHAKDAALWPRPKYSVPELPDGTFWDNEIGALMTDEDGTLIELL